MRRRARTLGKRALLTIAAIALAVPVLIELGVRIATHTAFDFGGPDSERYVVRDAVVGRLPRPGLVFRHPRGFMITIGEHSTRSNGNPPPRTETPPALAVGDSFAFGDEVDDEDSWPAVLERLLGRRAVNAGVPGFGLDQAVLRAEQLAEIYRPDTIVVSFIPHDVLRCGMSYWSGHAKPYFSIDQSGLELHPMPVRSASASTLLKEVLSVSVTMDLLFPRFLHWEGPEVVEVHPHGREVACRLMQRLAALGAARSARIVVLAQPQNADGSPEDLEIKDGVLACAAANHLSALDLFPLMDRLPPEQRSRLFDRHMTVEGNRWVGTELARFLERGDALPRSREAS